MNKLSVIIANIDKIVVPIHNDLMKNDKPAIRKAIYKFKGLRQRLCTSFI